MAQVAVPGEVGGRIVDRQGAVLPGVRITVSSADERRDAITDADGRFVVRSLKLGTYRVSTELAGFISKSGAVTLSPAIPRVHVAWALEAGCLNEDLRVILDVREAAPIVDAIVHIRVESDNGSVSWSTRPDCNGMPMHEYTAHVLSTVPGRIVQARQTLPILTSPRSGRLHTGGEYLALLWPGGRATDELIFPVISGRVASPAGHVLSGMDVRQALEILGTWSREPRR